MHGFNTQIAERLSRRLDGIRDDLFALLDDLEKLLGGAHMRTGTTFSVLAFLARSFGVPATADAMKVLHHTMRMWEARDQFGPPALN
jgi:hypothetical protein